MNYKIINKNDKSYNYITTPITHEKDILDIIAICIENGTRNLMLSQQALTDEFFNLKTGLAGLALQKFINYNIKVAVVIEDRSKINDRFAELILELNKRNDFRVFESNEDAEDFILNMN